MVTTQVKSSVAQTEVPLTIQAGSTEGSDGFALLSITVPNRDTTKSAYGGQLRFYDVHVAKMFEVTDFLCQQLDSDSNINGYEWFYSAANGQTSMGRFRISCSLARDIATAYGLGKTERTAIGLDTEGGPPESNVYSIPILNITGSKVRNGWILCKGFALSLAAKVLMLLLVLTHLFP
jgi:serine/threonine-protein kinase